LDLNDLKDLKDLTDFTGDTVPSRGVDFVREEEREVPETPRLKPVSLGGVMEGERLWWSEAEITGHDPQDPADDGEGINGVGFLPVSLLHSQFPRAYPTTLDSPYLKDKPEGVGRDIAGELSVMLILGRGTC